MESIYLRKEKRERTPSRFLCLSQLQPHPTVQTWGGGTAAQAHDLWAGLTRPTGSASTSVGFCLSMSTFMDAIKETELF